MDDLRGKHVVVVGATGALGGALVETLLACGATVSAASRLRTSLDALRADARNSDRLHVVECDATNAAGVESMFSALERGTAPIYGVVNTVGGFAHGSVATTEDPTIERLYGALFLSSVLVARAAVRRMVSRRDGRIVLTGGLASTKPAPNAAVYGAMKAAVAHFVQSLAAEVAGDGITVNALLPGTIDTPANRREMPKADPANWVAPRTLAKVVMSLFGESGAGINGALITVPDRV